MEDLAAHPLSFSLAGMAGLGGAELPLQVPLVRATAAVFQKKNIFFKPFSSPSISDVRNNHTSFHEQISFKRLKQKPKDETFDPYQPLALGWSCGRLCLPGLVCHNELQTGAQCPGTLASGSQTTTTTPTRCSAHKRNIS